MTHWERKGMYLPTSSRPVLPAHSLSKLTLSKPIPTRPLTDSKQADSKQSVDRFPAGQFQANQFRKQYQSLRRQRERGDQENIATVMVNGDWVGLWRLEVQKKIFGIWSTPEFLVRLLVRFLGETLQCASTTTTQMRFMFKWRSTYLCPKGSPLTRLLISMVDGDLVGLWWAGWRACRHGERFSGFGWAGSHILQSSYGHHLKNLICNRTVNAKGSYYKTVRYMPDKPASENCLHSGYAKH